jgi:hypothetical protein
VWAENSAWPGGALRFALALTAPESATGNTRTAELRDEYYEQD